MASKYLLLRFSKDDAGKRKHVMSKTDLMLHDIFNNMNRILKYFYR